MIVGEILLAILFGNDGDHDESEVVDPHKKSQVIFVVISKEGAMRRRFVVQLRRKLADTVGYPVWVRRERERERGRRSTQEVAVDICGNVQGRSNAPKICCEASQEACRYVWRSCLGTTGTRAKSSIHTRSRS